jgi:hypothetical protein
LLPLHWKPSCWQVVLLAALLVLLRMLVLLRLLLVQDAAGLVERSPPAHACCTEAPTDPRGV